MSLNFTARKLHIGIYGKRNSGKSTLVNALMGYPTLNRNHVEAATKDSVYKSIEIQGIGECVLIDTVGFDDGNHTDQILLEKTKRAMQSCDIAIIVCSEEDIDQEIEWVKEFNSRNTPVVMVINKIDQITNTDKIRNRIHDELNIEPLKISAISRMGIEAIKEEMIHKLPKDYEEKIVFSHSVSMGDTVLLVVPEESLIYKEETVTAYELLLRELINLKCIIISATYDQFDGVIKEFVKPPKHIIAPEKSFSLIHQKKPIESILTCVNFDQ